MENTINQIDMPELMSTWRFQGIQVSILNRILEMLDKDVIIVTSFKIVILIICVLLSIAVGDIFFL